MAFIYGSIFSHFNEATLNSINQLKSLMNWNNSSLTEICDDNFIGGILYDQLLPYSQRDFFYKDNDNHTIVLMSGVIYNPESLREKCGLTSDYTFYPELICTSFLNFGENFVSLLNGDFAIVIIDLKNHKTLIFRDHLGVRPIAYCLKDSNLFFSSDFISLSKVLYSDENIDELFILQGLTKDNLWDYTLTPNKHITKLLPGHYLEYSDNIVKQIKYWIPEKIKLNKKLNIETMLSELREILLNSVKIRCDKRFYSSAHISGGLDSGLIAVMARNEYMDQEKFYGFSWSPLGGPDKIVGLDERVYAEEICKFGAITLKLSEITNTDIIDYFSDLRCRLGYYDELRIRNDARNLGINLIFSGLGGDEFLSCHDRGIDSDLLLKFKWISFLKRNSLKSPKRLIAKILFNVLLPYLGYARFSYNPVKKIRKYILIQKCKKAKKSETLLTWRSRNDVHIGYIYYYHLASRMEEWSLCGYRLGIEYRYPLLDKRIVEYMLTIPSKLLISDSRFLMKELCKGILPVNVLNNTKLVDNAWGNMIDKIFLNSLDDFLVEFEQYRHNRYLNFINFDLLYEDIMKYTKKQKTDESYEPFTILYSIKSIHEFTKKFHEEV